MKTPVKITRVTGKSGGKKIESAKKKALPHLEADFMSQISPLFHLLDQYFQYEVIDIEKARVKGAGLLVMNHGIIPFHGFLLAKHLFDAGIMSRGLGADFLFQIPGLKEIFSKGGAVPASPENATLLLKKGYLVTLAPGGIYEALVVEPGMKRIPWERRYGFVELACKLKVPIIPSFCHGINETYFSSKFLLKERIKLLEKTRFSLPLFFGIGLLPFPVKLKHVIGSPISVTRRRGEPFFAQVSRIHGEVIEAIEALRDHPPASAISEEAAANKKETKKRFQALPQLEKGLSQAFKRIHG